MNRTLVVGRGFIGRAVAEVMRPDEVRLVGHAAIGDPDLLRGVATVIYAGRSPALGTDAWRLEDDLELTLARLAAPAHVSLLSLGTRKVYAPFGGPLNETDRVGPTDLYGRQKLELEHALAAVLGQRLTRLRLANIIGYETALGRTTFMAQLLGSLARRGEIRLDVSPFVRRDFLPVAFCARWLAELARRPPGGVLNIGSGVALPLGRLALWVIEGYGRGRLVVERPDERDSFVLETRNLRSLLGGAACTADDLAESCRTLGRRLRGAGEPH